MSKIWEVTGAVTEPKGQASKVGKEAGPCLEGWGGLGFRA